MWLDLESTLSPEFALWVDVVVDVSRTASI
jgi:hypothetical protein